MISGKGYQGLKMMSIQIGAFPWAPRGL